MSYGLVLRYRTFNPRLADSESPALFFLERIRQSVPSGVVSQGAVHAADQKLHPGLAPDLNRKLDLTRSHLELFLFADCCLDFDEVALPLYREIEVVAEVVVDNVTGEDASAVLRHPATRWHRAAELAKMDEEATGYYAALTAMIVAGNDRPQVQHASDFLAKAKQ